MSLSLDRWRLIIFEYYGKRKFHFTNEEIEIWVSFTSSMFSMDNFQSNLTSLKWFASLFRMSSTFFNITGEKSFCFERSIEIRDFSVSLRRSFLWDNFQSTRLKDKRFPIAWPTTFDHFWILWKKKISFYQRGDWNLSFFHFVDVRSLLWIIFSRI